MCKKVSKTVIGSEDADDSLEAVNNLKVGFMLLVRAVAKPNSPWREWL